MPSLSTFVHCPLFLITLLHPLRQNCCTVTRTRGGQHRDASPPPMRNHHPRPRRGGGSAAPPPPPPVLFLSCCIMAFCYMACLHDMVVRLMIDAAGSGVQSSLSGGAIVPVRGRAHWSLPGSGSTVGLPGGAVPGSGVGGGGRGHGFFGMAATTVMLGGIRLHHCRLDAGSHRPGPAPVGGMAQQPPAPRGCVGQAVIVGTLPQARHRGCGWGEHLARPRCGARGCMVS
jgi:hypothetical protein